jgi:uncharacterized phage-associated protein
MTTPVFNFDKTINSALYVAEKIRIKDFHRIFKILYFADREHLSKYGRPITGDTYIKMEAGPVPSNLYNIFKSVRGDGIPYDHLNEYFSVYDEKLIKPEKEPDLRFLSKTDVSELDESISKYGELSFNELTKKSHDIAWNSAKKHGKIEVENILREAGEDEDYVSYISDFMNCQRFLLR